MTDDNYGFGTPAEPLGPDNEPVAVIEDDPEVDIFDRAEKDHLAHETESETQEDGAPSGFTSELQSLLNHYSAESVSGTPDYILAEFLTNVLKIYNETVFRRAQWRGEFADFNPSREVSYHDHFSGEKIKSPGDLQREAIARGEDLPRI